MLVLPDWLLSYVGRLNLELELQRRQAQEQATTEPEVKEEDS